MSARNSAIATDDTVLDYTHGFDRGYNDGQAAGSQQTYHGAIKQYVEGQNGKVRTHNPDAPEWWELPVHLDEVAEVMFSDSSPFASGYRVGYSRSYRISSIPTV